MLFARPFAWLTGQLVTFFLISLHVKLMQVRLTSRYGGSWWGWERFLENGSHLALFCAQEVALFTALLLGVALWRRIHPRAGAFAWAVIGMIGLGLLPLLSVTEVLGLGHFALFQTPLGADDVYMVGWSGHLVSSANLLDMPAVSAGLMLAVLGYLVFPPGLWWPRGLLVAQSGRTFLGLALAVSGVLLVLPKPTLPDALLEPHPALWVLAGHRPTEMASGAAAAAELPESSKGTPRYTVTRRPDNVLVLLIESTNARATAVYNPTTAAGRELLRYRNEMVVFDNVYAPVPTSAHALFSILYGVYPYIGPFWTRGDGEVVVESLAQVLAARGYRTHLYDTSDLNFDDVRSFAARGFELVRDPNDWPGQDAFAMLPWGRDDRLLFDEIRRTLATPDPRPFFLVAKTSNPHHPYAVDQLPGQAPKVDDAEAYQRLVAYNLRMVADLYRWMKDQRLADNTLFLVLGDHGEAFGEHPKNYGHSAAIYEENVHVPCFILHPKRLGLPQHIAQLGSQVDVRATVLDILGIAGDSGGDGQSLLWNDPARLVIHFTENGVGRFGARDARYTYIYTPHVDAEQLYDRRKDPREQHNIGPHEPLIRTRYRRWLQRWEAQHQLRLASIVP